MVILIILLAIKSVEMYRVLVVVMLAMVVKLMMGWAHKREILELVIRKVRATLMFLDTALA